MAAPCAGTGPEAAGGPGGKGGSCSRRAEEGVIRREKCLCPRGREKPRQRFELPLEPAPYKPVVKCVCVFAHVCVWGWVSRNGQEVL